MSNLEKEDRRVYEPRLHNPKTDRVIIYNDRESEIAYLSSKRILTYLEVQAADIYRKIWEIYFSPVGFCENLIYNYLKNKL